MELTRRRRKTFEFAPEDVISNMPDIVITNVLDQLPLQDAVRTCVLSRSWRFKWTMLSQLVFDVRFFAYLSKTRGQNNPVRIINRLLRQLKGAITKFVLSTDDNGYPILDAKDINRWIKILAKKGVKDLTIWKMHGLPLKLPNHLFSCLELKHLKLLYCWFDPPASFHGFPNLLSLEFCLVQFESSKFGEFGTLCPALEILDTRDKRPILDVFRVAYRHHPLELNMDNFSAGKVKLVEIAKLKNLKRLSLLMGDLDPIMITNFNSIFELVGSLPKLNELHLDFLHCKRTDVDAKQRLSTILPCLKVLKLSKIDLDSDIMVSCFFEMIRSFPNLQTLEISACQSIDTARTYGLCSQFCSPEIGHNMIGLLQLQSVVFTYYKATVNDEYLIKFLLACSPLLKKFIIRPWHSYTFLLNSDKKFSFARNLLKFHRASPVVDIDLS